MRPCRFGYPLRGTTGCIGLKRSSRPPDHGRELEVNARAGQICLCWLNPEHSSPVILAEFYSAWIPDCIIVSILIPILRL